MDSATSVERQLYILSLLSQSQKGYSLKEIIDHLRRVGIDATRRMVARDMDSISTNFYVYEEEADGSVVYKADKYAVSAIDFTMPQIISLYYLKQILKTDQPGDIAGEAAGIIDKILGQMPKLSQTALADVEKMIKVVPARSAGEQVDEAVLDAMRAAAAECRTVDVEYASFSSGQTERRLFDPYILEVREGNWHAIGHCHLRGSVRDLRISRIKSAAVTDEAFAVPAGFYEQYKRTRFDKLAGEETYEICVRFTGKAARLVEEYHADKADSLDRQGEQLIFRKRAALTGDLLQWLLGFGAGARVLEPAELADAVAKEAGRMAELYK